MAPATQHRIALSDRNFGSSLLSVGTRGFPANFWNCAAPGEATPARLFGSPALTQSPNTTPLYAVNMNTSHCNVARLRGLDRAKRSKRLTRVREVGVEPSGDRATATAHASFGHAGGMKAISLRLSAATPQEPHPNQNASQRDASIHRERFRSLGALAGIPLGCAFIGRIPVVLLRSTTGLSKSL